MSIAGPLRVEIVPARALTVAQSRSILRLCERAYGEGEDFAALLQTFSDATHVMLADAQGRLVSHALWIERWLSHRDRPLCSAYVELVATDPDQQRQGHASRVMHALAGAIEAYDAGVLSPSDPSFYARLGWELWRGPLFEQRQDGVTIASPAQERVMVLPRRYGPELDIDGALTAPWRPGEVW